MAFIHLHVHTEFSLLDGLSKLKPLVKKAKAMGMTALAITDHGVAYGLPNFYSACKDEGIKPILGCEFYVAPGNRTDKKERTPLGKAYYHLILLVKDETGYKNLCKLVSRSNMEGFYYKPRIDWELLKEFHEGLICLSACVAGEVAQNILAGKEEEAQKVAERYQELFGDDYYLEIQNHGSDEERIAYDGVIRIAKKTGIKLVVTNDSHYIDTADKEAHDWLLCMQMQQKLTDKDRMTYTGDYSLRSEEEMRSLFPAVPEACDNTMEVADKVVFEFKYGDYRMPKVVIPESYGDDYFGYLADEARKGLEERYPEGHSLRESAVKRLEYELSVVKQMGFASYFIDTRKTILWARNHNILVGPGRGSAAGSVMCYCLKITDIEPLRYGLLFERFLNPERISMPDIDVDYDYSHKEEVVASEAESNGYDKFAKIQTTSTMKAKGIIRDCYRVAGYPAATGNIVAKMIPELPGETLEAAWNENPDIKAYYDSHPEELEVYQIAEKLQGARKSAGTHACGHIPTPVPCEELFPVSVDQETGYLVCQYDMIEAEHLGNLKKDLLMLRNLTVIDIAHKEIKKRYGKDIPLWTEEILNDKKALEMISRGETDGVFQFESDGMKDFMKKLKPDCFEDMIAGVALYRPGPMDYIPRYIMGKKVPDTVTYATPQLESILKNTYGVIVYQEQVMQVVQKLAGYSMGRADLLRKAMGKKRQEIMDAERKVFVYGNAEEIAEAASKGKEPPKEVKGCIANGISEEVANTIYDEMADFAKYAFNKSHAAAYAAISMQTAYLKANYPTEFFAGLLTSVSDSITKLVKYVSTVRKLGIKIDNPDINVSIAAFTVGENGDVYYGLDSLKGVGEAKVKQIVEEREKNGKFKSLTDFIYRVDDVNKTLMEALIGSGAFDFTGFSRNAMLTAYPGIIKEKKKGEKDDIEGQMSLFDMFTEASPKETDSFRDLPELSPKELRLLEKESTGFYVSSHPTDDFDKWIEKNTDQTSETISNVKAKIPVYVAGLVSQVKVIYTKKGQQMAYLKVEDKYGEMSVTVFPKLYEEVKGTLQKEDPIIWVLGMTQKTDNGTEILAERLCDIDTVRCNYWLKIEEGDDLAKIQQDLDAFAKSHPKTDAQGVMIYRYFVSTKEVKLSHCKVDSSESAYRDFEKLFGKSKVAKTKQDYMQIYMY